MLPSAVIKPQAQVYRAQPAAEKAFAWADVLAGDIGAIRRYAPANLKRKTVVVECATPEDVADLRERGVSILVTLMPSTDGEKTLGTLVRRCDRSHACCAHAKTQTPPSTKTPTSISWPTSSGRPAFATSNPPKQASIALPSSSTPSTSASSTTTKPSVGPAICPDKLVETVAAYMWPMYISRITGGQSPTTGQKIEGHLYSLAATPREMMRHGERFTYSRLNMGGTHG